MMALCCNTVLWNVATAREVNSRMRTCCNFVSPVRRLTACVGLHGIGLPLSSGHSVSNVT